MTPILYIFVGVVLGAIIGWLVGSRYKPNFDKRVEDELRAQITKNEGTIAYLQSQDAVSKAACSAAEALKTYAEQELKQEEGLRQTAEHTISKLREELADTGSQLATANAQFAAQKELTLSAVADRDVARNINGDLQNTVLTSTARISDLEADLKVANSQLDAQKKLTNSAAGDRDTAIAKKDELQYAAQGTSARIASLEADLRLANERLETERKAITDLQQKFQKEFEAVSNKLLLESSAQFSKQSNEGLTALLSPLKLNLDEFKAKLETAHKDAASQSAVLGEQIKNIGNEAASLSKALKGDVKILGNWGENMLDLILEKSGLRKDIHYRRQQGFKDEIGDQKFLDVIVDLPDDKHLVIDSKVSLIHYDDHIQCSDETLRFGHIIKHVECIKSHIKGLSGKLYHNLKGVNSPDFVLMYIPIEAAFFTAISHDKDLFSFALERDVVLITNSTLLATLRTVSSVWRLAEQKQNYVEIADRGGKLYDKFVAFMSDMQEVGNALKKGQNAWDDASKKLSTGSGNLIRQAEILRKLGVNATKRLAVQIIENADEDIIPTQPGNERKRLPLSDEINDLSSER